MNLRNIYDSRRIWKIGLITVSLLLMGMFLLISNHLVKDLAKQGGYVYVFDVSSLLYYDDAQSTDLTPLARKALGIADDRTLESLQAELQAQQQAQAGN